MNLWLIFGLFSAVAWAILDSGNTEAGFIEGLDEEGAGEFPKSRAIVIFVFRLSLLFVVALSWPLFVFEIYLGRKA